MKINELTNKGTLDVLLLGVEEKVGTGTIIHMLFFR